MLRIDWSPTGPILKHEEADRMLNFNELRVIKQQLFLQKRRRYFASNALGQLGCLDLSCYRKIDSNLFINISITFKILRGEISDVVL